VFEQDSNAQIGFCWGIGVDGFVVIFGILGSLQNQVVLISFAPFPTGYVNLHHF